jgi:hypothetical protein
LAAQSPTVIYTVAGTARIPGHAIDWIALDAAGRYADVLAVADAVVAAVRDDMPEVQENVTELLQVELPGFNEMLDALPAVTHVDDDPGGEPVQDRPGAQRASPAASLPGTADR